MSTSCAQHGLARALEHEWVRIYGSGQPIRVQSVSPQEMSSAARVVWSQFAHHGGGKVGRTEGLSYHVDQLRARGVATEVGHLNVGDALWIARSRCPEPSYLDPLLQRSRGSALPNSSHKSLLSAGIFLHDAVARLYPLSPVRGWLRGVSKYQDPCVLSPIL